MRTLSIMPNAATNQAPFLHFSPQCRAEGRMYFRALAAVLPVVLPVRNGHILRTVRVELVQPVRCYRIFLLYWDDSWGFGESRDRKEC